MNRLIATAVICFAFTTLINAQEQRESFDRNSWNWQEISTKKNSAINGNKNTE